MSEERIIKLNIHYCGSMVKVEERYEYHGERVEFESVDWKLSDIRWNKFEDFIIEANMRKSISLLWFKKPNEGMEKIQYAIDTLGVRVTELCECAKERGEVDVYVEHDCSEMRVNDVVLGENDANYDAEDESGEADGDESEVEEKEIEDRDREADVEETDEEEVDAEESDDEVIPKDDTDVIESENEVGDEILDEIEKNKATDVDDGEEVVLEFRDATMDARFNALFKEAEDADREKNRDKAEKKLIIREESDDSDGDYGILQEPYPDTPVDTDEEWEKLKEKPKKKGKGIGQFHGDYDEEPYLWLFQTFRNGDEFKSQLLRYALKKQFDVKMAKSEGRRIVVVCCTDNCKWKVFCLVEVPINKWMVKVCHNHHNHSKNSRVRLLKQGVIASLYREKLRRRVYMTANEIKDSIKERYNCIVSRYKCSKAKRIALDVVLQDQATQFAKLWNYEAELHRSNPGITTEICTVPLRGEQVFDKFYICFKELRNTWKKCCRPVIGLDGCFCRWDLKGELLAAVGRDADNRIYPLAWAIVRGENNETWAWFVSKLKVDLGLGLGDKITIISDKQKGIVNAIANDLPNVEHRMCARHIYANWKKKFSSPEYKCMFWYVAYSYREGEFDDKMKLLKDYDLAAYEALLRTEPKTWSRAFFTVESQCMDVHNNLSESFNRTIREARMKPIINLLETLRRQTMDRISRRWKKTIKWDAQVTPITLQVLEKARIDGKYCSTIRNSSSVYEVCEFDNWYTVNLASHQCACRRWDLTGIPCKHAVCVINDNEEDVNKYVADYYSSTLWKGNYADNINPVNGENLWKKIDRIPIGVPEYRRPPGRPKSYRRKKDPYESPTKKGKVTRHGRTIHCSNCGEANHNKAKCKNPTMLVPPKKKRGRPRKNPQEMPIHRQPRSAPTKASKITAKSNSKTTTKKRDVKKRKTNQAANSSQPILAEGSARVFPEASSVSRPSVLSNQPQQKKKPPRGKQLKVKKSVTLPQGQGVLTCPYTNRVFDVWGSRAYNISDSFTTQQPRE